MQALVEKATGKVLCLTEEEIPVFSGTWGDGLKDGTLHLVPVVEPAPLEELAVVGGVVVVDPTIKAEKDQHANLLNKLKAIKKADLDTLDKCADAILDIVKVLKRMLK